MVFNTLYKCDICGTILRLRYQVGFSNIPVSLYCPQCNSHIFGQIIIDNEKVSITENVKNAERVTDDTAFDYVVGMPKRYPS